jgi:hypothetical protein
MEPLKLLSVNFKIFKVYSLKFSYGKTWIGLLLQCLYLSYIVAYVLELIMIFYYMIYRAESLSEIADCLSKALALFYPPFRSFCIYLQRKTVNNAFEEMTGIWHERE